MRPNVRTIRISHAGYVITLAGAHWVLFDAAGGYLGTVRSPSSELGFGHCAPTVLLGNRAPDLEFDEVSHVRVGAKSVALPGSIEPQACDERLRIGEGCGY